MEKNRASKRKVGKKVKCVEHQESKQGESRLEGWCVHLQLRERKSAWLRRQATKNTVARGN